MLAHLLVDCLLASSLALHAAASAASRCFMLAVFASTRSRASGQQTHQQQQHRRHSTCLNHSIICSIFICQVKQRLYSVHAKHQDFVLHLNHHELRMCCVHLQSVGPGTPGAAACLALF
jgi:hypothetical protein